MSRTFVIWLCLGAVLFGWGLSWELLPYQTGAPGLPEATVPVFYRFLLAGGLFTTFILIRDAIRRRISFAFSLSTWGLIALIGLTFFSLNYSLFYMGQRGLPPGLVALFFAFVVVTNLGVTTLFSGRWPRRSTTLAALAGFSGLTAVLWPSIWADGGFDLDLFTLGQATLCLLGTLTVSFGTMVQVVLNRRQVPVVTSTAFAMLFGTVYVGLYSWLRGYSFDISAVPGSFYGALAVLVLFSSIGAFSAYLKLVGLIGANRGAYVNLGTAVVALIISYVTGTGDSFTLAQFAGIGLILAGCFFILQDKTPLEGSGHPK